MQACWIVKEELHLWERWFAICPINLIAITFVGGITFVVVTRSADLLEIMSCVLRKCVCRISDKVNHKTSLHYVNVSVLIKFSQKTSVFTLIIVSSP